MVVRGCAALSEKSISSNVTGLDKLRRIVSGIDANKDFLS